MKHSLHTMTSAEEAQVRQDVHAVLEEAGGALTEDEILERVRYRELQRLVDGLVEDGLLAEVEKGSYFPTKKGLQWAARAMPRP